MKNSIGKKLVKQAGFTLIELLIVVAIVALIVVGVVNFGTKASTKTEAADIKTTISSVVTSLKPLYRNSFAGIANCDNLVTNDVFAKTSFRIDKTTPANPIVLYSSDPGSTVACASATIANPNDGVALTLANMTDDMCSAAIDEVAPLAWLISIDGTQVKARSGALNIGTKGTLCTNTAATTDAHSVTFTLSRANPPQ